LEDCAGYYRLAAGDIADENTVCHIIADTRPDGVFHLAAYGVDPAQRDISQAVNVNVNGMVNLLKAMTASGCRRIITVGSGAEYGNHLGPVSEDAPLHPEDAYASTKAAATIIAHQYAAQNGIGIVTLRPFGVYGEAEPRHKVFCHAILSMLRGKTLRLTAGTQCRDYCYVGDVVDACLAAYAKEDLRKTIFNIGTGNARALRHYIEQIRDIIKPDSDVCYGALPYRDNELWSPQPDVRLAAQQLSWLSTTSLEEGLHKTIGWYRENGHSYQS
jgi:nucleoside-diphosphate-sugar epimerase